MSENSWIELRPDADSRGNARWAIVSPDPILNQWGHPELNGHLRTDGEPNAGLWAYPFNVHALAEKALGRIMHKAAK